jgi:hypothetical protein
VGAIVPRLVQNTSWITRPYLDLTGTRQHWGLFAPNPADWTGTVKVLPYFSVTAPDGSDAWRGDTLVVEGAIEADYPHFRHHRSYRVLYELGDAGQDGVYAQLFAREMCRTLRDTRWRPPDGLSLYLTWSEIVTPWADGAPSDSTMWIGGFTCSELDGDGAAEPWPVYGLPDPVVTDEWPLVLPDSAAVAVGLGATSDPEGRT